MIKRLRLAPYLQEPPSEYVEDLQSLSEITDADIEGPSLFSRFLEVQRAAGYPREPPPKCFGCSEADGALELSIRKTGQGDTYTRWKSAEVFTDGEGRLATTMVVSAIDCMNLYAVNAKDDFDLLFKLIKEKKTFFTGSWGSHLSCASCGN